MAGKKMMLVYVVCASEKEAEKIASAAVKERLAACANYWPCRSVFEWKGRLEKQKEAILVLKTTGGKLKPLVRRMKQLHSYELPCICWWKEHADSPYENWVGKQVRLEPG